MRILIYLTLGMLSLVGLFYGVRLIWLALHPASAPGPLPMPAWLTAHNQRLLLLAAAVGLCMLALSDLISTQSDPGEHQPPPPVTTSGAVVQPRSSR